jgi:hypothetical protein
MAYPLVILLLLVAGSVVWGFVRDLRRPDVTEPLGQIAWLYGTFMVIYLALAALRIKDGFYGGGQAGSVCVNTSLGGGGSVLSAAGWRARPGGSLGVADIQACVLHPSAADGAMFLLTQLPGLLLWGGVLLMIFRLIRHAVRRGPFTPRASSLMRQLGWLIVLGAALVGALDTLGISVLTDAVLRPQPYDAGGIVGNVLLLGAIKALFPVPLLAGAALITFGRITRVGAAMDEEIKATV